MATTEIVSSYSESNYSTYYQLVDNQVAAGQSFNPKGQSIWSVKFYLRKFGSPTGNAVVKIYKQSTTGTALATSDNFDVSTLTTSFALTEFVFTGDNRITFAGSAEYFAILHYSSGVSPNYVAFGVDATTPSAGGNFIYNNGTWDSMSTWDSLYYIYGVQKNDFFSIFFPRIIR